MAFVFQFVMDTKHTPKTHKQKQFVKEYIKTGNATEAASRVYKTKNRNSAKSIGSENLTKLDISSALENQGINEEYLASILADGLKSSRHIAFNEGKKIIKVPDYGNRLKFLTIALRLKGYLDTDSVNPKNKTSEINPYKDLSLEELREIVDGLESEEEIRNRKYTPKQVIQLNNENSIKSEVFDPNQPFCNG